MSINISEFERTKPTATMKAINDLEHYIEYALNENNKINPYQSIIEIYIQLKDIKRKFKAGE